MTPLTKIQAATVVNHNESLFANSADHGEDCLSTVSCKSSITLEMVAAGLPDGSLVKYCVYGLGAIGGLIAGRLAAAGVEVTAVARGETLDAVRTNGLIVLDGDENSATGSHVQVSDDPRALPAPDCVIVAVKATALSDIADDLAELVAGGATILTAMNGIPWWFFDGFGGDLEGTALNSVDPGARVQRLLPASRTAGAVVHLSSSVPAPGVVRHRAGRRLVVGPAIGADRARSEEYVADLTAAGFDAELTDDIRREIWFKLWGNMSLNPISMLTGATMDLILDDPYLHDFVERCMREAATVGDRLGLPIDQSPRDRLRHTRKLGAAKTSMLQDAEAGRLIELDQLVGAVVELADLTGTDTPSMNALLGLSRVHAGVHGLRRAGVSP
ncbi:ketopantoate reductase family protein [Rhodococcus artemisiae]|uniref:2-dehydropantoate 2-reductase n=1 Tax=Rhodococcus artemisiae TaxID=714159 RepID=A0ABU7LFS4_9NOCA|nr:2-dehydropantoate 2-reductase [Rhodococcus artemisiae]MEE2060411.1 2-dehydropantoate 2-reductase [Rhodococcus artemisiae]